MSGHTFGSLFAGIGGFDLGLERAGWTCRWQVEIDPFCQRVLARHWPHVTRYGDITTLDLESIERVDLICGGFPCQPVSQAGQKLAQADARWLWPEFYRVICALRPRYVLVENVAGLLGRGLGHVLGDLAEGGYDAEWNCISAAAFGAPHLRDRVWILAHAEEGLRDRVLFPGPRHGEGVEQGFQRVWAVLRARRARDEAPANFSRLRADDGLSARLDEIAALGNAIVPQVAEWIGRRLNGV